MRFGIRELAFVVVLLAMPVAAYLFVFQPRNLQIAEAKAEVQQKQQKLAQLEQATQNMEDLGAEIEKLSEAIDLFERKLPEKQEVEGILQDVWNLASEHQLTPKSIRTEKEQGTAQYTELPIKMVIVGDFDGFYEFLLDLEKLPRITRTPTMQLKKLHRDEEGVMQADLVLSIFFEGESLAGGRS